MTGLSLSGFSMALIFGSLFIGIMLIAFLIISCAQNTWQQEKQKITAQWQQDFSSMFIFLNSKTMFAIHCTLSVLLPSIIYGLTGHLILSAISALSVVLAPKYLIHFAKKQRLNQIEAQLPDALMQIAGALKSGASLLNALELISDNSTGPIAQEFGLFVREYRMGTTIDQALKNLEMRVLSENIGLAVTTISIAQDTGGNLSESLERLASSVRQKMMIEKKIDSLTSQGKLQGIVVGLLPVGIGAVLLKIEPEAMNLIFSTWFGYITILIIIVLETLGLLSIKKIITIDV
jgi:tight adherence protein B